MLHGRSSRKRLRISSILTFGDAKRKEFMSLVQGNMIVIEYEKRFTKLVKYVVAFVIDETNKCKWFEEGLRTGIKAPVMAT